MTHAPGMSAYNYVERQMAPLSRALAGLVLPHESCGSHLDASGKTVDEELEKKKFQGCWRNFVRSVGRTGARWTSCHCRIC